MGICTRYSPGWIFSTLYVCGTGPDAAFGDRVITAIFTAIGALIGSAIQPGTGTIGGALIGAILGAVGSRLSECECENGNAKCIRIDMFFPVPPFFTVLPSPGSCRTLLDSNCNCV